jgi:UDP-N-acetyl-D-mannosaminuronic acid dehydrogenase
MKVSVIGLGYIGLPTAAILAKNNIEVIGVDVNQSAVDTINDGKIHFVEPELDTLVQSAIKKGYLHAVTQPKKADVFIIAVPTPFKGEYKPDLSYIEAATKNIARVLEKGNIVILESTSPVGTTEKILEWMKEIRPDLNFPKFRDHESSADIAVAHCPERVLPGKVIKEIVKNDRIIGGVTQKCAKLATEIYKIFVEGNCLETDCRTAELSKLVENSFRDVNIAFANELSLICDKLNINVWELIRFSNLHPRVNILQPGPGVGGHCIAVDPWFIVNSAPKEARLIKEARLVNDSKPNFVLDKINQAVNNSGKKKAELKIACLGLSFKPNIDDMRESPAMDIALKVNLMGFNKLYIVEPNINILNSDFELKNSQLLDLNSAIKRSDVIVLLVDHDQFKLINLELLSGKHIIDTRGIWAI